MESVMVSFARLKCFFHEIKEMGGRCMPHRNLSYGAVGKKYFQSTCGTAAQPLIYRASSPLFTLTEDNSYEHH